jgi:hypothetical protein
MLLLFIEALELKTTGIVFFLEHGDGDQMMRWAGVRNPFAER